MFSILLPHRLITKKGIQFRTCSYSYCRIQKCKNSRNDEIEWLFIFRGLTIYITDKEHRP